MIEPARDDGAAGSPAVPIVNGRQADDVLAGVIRLELGGRLYVLRVLPIRPEREWKQGLEVRLAGTLVAIDEAGGGGAIMEAIERLGVDEWLDALYAYDRANVLPPRGELEEVASATEVVRAVMEVWATANPLVGIALATMSGILARPPSAESRRTSSRRRHTAGRPASSRTA